MSTCSRPPLQVPSRVADDADGADARATFPFAQLARHPPPAQHFGTLSHRHAGHVARRIPECRGIHIVENLSGEEGDAGRLQKLRRGAPRAPPGEYHAAGAKRCPLGTRRADRRLTDRCVALVQPGAGALRYILSSAASAPSAKQTKRAAAAVTRNSWIGTEYSQVCVLICGLLKT